MANLNWKYKIIPKIFSSKELKILNYYCKAKHFSNQENFDIDQNNNGDTFFYRDILMDAYLKDKKKIFEKHSNLKLEETYSFWRCYTFNAELEKHVDRNACEISTTIAIGSDGVEWPIYIDGNPINLKPGDGVIYKGREYEHWREPYTGDYHIQLFLHYVDANGPLARHAGDLHNEKKKRGPQG
jgi:hypothetical protein